MRTPFMKRVLMGVIAAGTLGLLAPQVSLAQCYTTYETQYYGYTPYQTRVVTSPVVVEPTYTRTYWSDPGLVNVGVPGLANVNVGGFHLLHVGTPLLHFNLF